MDKFGRIDILINNAAQTVRRPAGFYAHLMENEEKTIVIKDADTELPIEAATVFVVKTKQTLLSNEEGKVSFILDGISNIQITNSTYSSLKVKSTTLKEKNNISIDISNHKKGIYILEIKTSENLIFEKIVNY